MWHVGIDMPFLFIHLSNPIHMQHLSYPFPRAISPFADALESQAKQWIYTDYAHLPDRVKKKYELTHVGQVGATLYPNGDLAGLLSICRFSLWAFVNDDAYERCTAEQLQQIRTRVLAALNGQGDIADVMDRQLAILREDLLRQATPGWFQRFVTSIDSYFKGMLAEIPYRKDMRYPSLAEYMAIRELAACVYPLVDLIELETGRVLPDEIALHPVIRELARLTCRIMAFCNDLYSYQTEDGKDVLNLVLVLRKEYNCSTEEAYSRALEIHNRDVQLFVALRACLSEFGQYANAVSAFVDALGMMIQGHLYWLDNHTQRYKEHGHPGSDFNT